MSARVISLTEKPLPEKPMMDAPCNGCGLCCSVEVCPAGMIAFPGAVAPCPGIRIIDGKARCLIMLKLPDFKHLLGEGVGCCMTDRFRDRQQLSADKTRSTNTQ